MAGIGFELKKIYAKKTLGSNLWGTFYATMTILGPAILSMVLVWVAFFLMDWSDATHLEKRFFVSAITYALLIGLLVSTSINSTMSRYISDCIFNNDEKDIWASAVGVLTLSTFISGIIMLIMCLSIYYLSGEPSLPFVVGYYFIGVLVTDTYSITNYISAMKQYRHITMVYLLGMLVIAVVYVFCIRYLGTGSVIAGCYSVASCYFVILSMLVILGIRTLGISRCRYFAFLPYFRQYPMLAISGFAYMLALFLPNIIYWSFSNMREHISIFYTTPVYDQAMFLAIIINMPSMVIFVVKVETAFYEKYVLYVSALNGGSYNLIEKERINMSRVIYQQLCFVYDIQLLITVVLICLANVFLPFIGIGTQVLNMFNVLGLGIYAVFCISYTIIVLQYFADYSGACIGALVFLGVTAIFTVVGLITYFYALPLLVGGISGWMCSFMLLRHRMNKLNSFLMCK